MIGQRIACQLTAFFEIHRPDSGLAQENQGNFALSPITSKCTTCNHFKVHVPPDAALRTGGITANYLVNCFYDHPARSPLIGGIGIRERWGLNTALHRPGCAREHHHHYHHSALCPADARPHQTPRPEPLPELSEHDQAAAQRAPRKRDSGRRRYSLSA